PPRRPDTRPPTSRSRAAGRSASTRSTRAPPAPAPPRAPSPARATASSTCAAADGTSTAADPPACGRRPTPDPGLPRQRATAPTALEHHKTRLRRRVRWPLDREVLAQRLKEPPRDRHDPLAAALAVGDEQSPLASVHVSKPHAEHLAAAQPAEQHRQHHGPVAPGPQCAEQ